MSLTIVPMTTKDLEVVAHIEENAFEQPWSPHSFRTELIKNDLAHYMVARREGKVVGYGGIWVIFNEAHLTTLAVDEPYRRCGVGAALLKALMTRSAELGARRISLEVRPSNHAARSLYKKFGFKARGIRKDYYTDEDGLVMFKKISSADGEGEDDPAS
jgi:ribosomal-protein-alanine N-acetyltransferase